MTDPAMVDLQESIDALLAGPVRPVSAADHQATLFTLLREAVLWSAERSPAYRNYVRHWPVPPNRANDLADLPFLPVSAFKADPPLSLVQPNAVTRVVRSSSTTSSVPSSIVVDGVTARRMSRGTAAIASAVIGPSRRPYLVVDDARSIGSGASLNARGAAIRGLMPFATHTTSCLVERADGGFDINWTAIENFRFRFASGPVLIYGFTYILWSAFIEPLAEAGVTLGLNHAIVMHSGGWKRLRARAVEKADFNRTAATVIGCSPERIIDFYGMAENVGIIYPDCPVGNKHAPAFGGVMLRDPNTFAPVGPGERGLIQVMSTLPTSFPGHILLTEDLGELVHDDHCPCGWRGISFRFADRVPKAELRGCGDIAAKRSDELQRRAAE